MKKVNHIAITNHLADLGYDPHHTSTNFPPYKGATPSRSNVSRHRPRTTLCLHQRISKTLETEKESCCMSHNQGLLSYYQRLDSKTPIPDRLADHLLRKKMNTSPLVGVPNEMPKELFKLKKISLSEQLYQKANRYA